MFVKIDEKNIVLSHINTILGVFTGTKKHKIDGRVAKNEGSQNSPGIPADPADPAQEVRPRTSLPHAPGVRMT